MPLISEAKPFLPQKININPGKKSAVFVSAKQFIYFFMQKYEVAELFF